MLSALSAADAEFLIVGAHAEADLGGATYPVIGKREYVRNQRSVGRPQDLADADHVERSPID